MYKREWKDFSPFYAAYGSPLLYAGERAQEREFALMKSWYPKEAQEIQERVETECQLLDYEGSRLYDEYPDRFMLRRLGDRIVQDMKGEMEAQGMSSGFLDELVEVLLYQEISRRRCCRRRCRGY